jgi:LmbE family N-acetylglucosaminyl deacetylase
MAGIGLAALLFAGLAYANHVWRAPVLLTDAAAGLRWTEELIARAPRTLIVAAHPDDIEWYMGGTAARLTEAGAEVTIVMATNGEAGRGRDVPASGGGLGAVRRAEQVEAARRLGVADVRFLDLPDGGLHRRADLVDRVREVWAEVGPELVFSFDAELPRPPYVHGDHQAVGAAVAEIAAGPLGAKAHVLLFHTKAPDVLVDISGTLDRKVEALMAHRTQVGAGSAVIAMHRGSAGPVGRQAGVEYGEPFRRLPGLR